MNENQHKALALAQSKIREAQALISCVRDELPRPETGYVNNGRRHRLLKQWHSLDMAYRGIDLAIKARKR